jgi:hypothetical protein
MRRIPLNLTITFSDPHYLVTLSAALLPLGWAIGARWGHTSTADYVLAGAIVALIIHDLTITVLAGIGGYKYAKHLRNREWR